MKKISSKPRRVRVTFKHDPDNPIEFVSVSEASRLVGVGRTHLQGMLSGRTGKRSIFTVEYVK